MDKNPMGNGITMYHLVQIALDLSGEMKDLVAFVKNEGRKHSEKLREEWIDGSEVMNLLRIKKVTLQKLRDTGILPFSSIIGKFYYKTADIEALLKTNYRKVNNKS